MDKQYDKRTRRTGRRPEKRKYTSVYSERHLKISNWKIPGHDAMHGFWFKKFTSIHDRPALEMNKCLQRAHIPEWMTKGKTTLIQKDTSKEDSQTIKE